MSNYRTIRRTAGLALLLNSAAALPTAAQAQVAATAGSAANGQQSSDDAGNDIVVTGVRASVIDAIKTKKNLDIIADVISAEDIGKFPDTNIAESLQRVPGVQITRERGEGKYASVRGLPPEFNVVTLNGELVASASNDQTTQQADRRFDFTILSPDFIQSLEVYKSTRADLDEGGVAATINIRTIRPLDLGKRRISLEVAGKDEDNSGKITPEVSGVYSDVFAGGKIGVTLGAVYTRRHLQDQGSTTSQLDPLTLTAAQIGVGVPLTPGTPYYIADAVDRNFFDEVRTRKTFLATVQIEPVEHLRLTLDGLYSSYLGVGQTASFTARPIYGIGSGAPITAADIDENGVITSLRTTDTAIEDGSFTKHDHSVLKNGAAEISWDDGSTTARLRGSYSESTSHIQEIGFDDFIWSALTGTSVPGGYDFSGGPVAAIALPNDTVPPIDNFGNNYVGGNDLRRNDRSIEYQWDLGHRFDNSFLSAIKAGFKFNDRRRTNGADLLLDERVRFLGGPAAQNLGRFVTKSPLKNYLDGYQGDALILRDFPYIDPQLYLDQCCNGSLADWQQEIRAAGTTGSDIRVQTDPGQQYSITEKTIAGYLLADFGDRDRLIDGNVGVRIVGTEQAVQTFGVDIANITPNPIVGAPPIVPSAGPAVYKRSYTDVLPSFNITLNAIPDKLLIRGAVGKVLSRPDLDALVPHYSVDTTSVPLTISGGNPNLNPYRAWQYDVSLEYYPRPGTLLSLAGYYKDISGYIYNGTTPLQIGSETYNAVIPINGKSAVLKGFEANAESVFDFLPSPFDGFGAQANLTYSDGTIRADPAQGRAARPFEGLSKITYNLVLFYEKYGLTVRAAYNSRDPFVDSADLRGLGIESVRTERFSSLDLHVGYDITKHISVFGDVINALDKPVVQTVSLFDTAQSYPFNYSEDGRRFAAGVRLVF